MYDHLSIPRLAMNIDEPNFSACCGESVLQHIVLESASNSHTEVL